MRVVWGTDLWRVGTMRAGHGVEVLKCLQTKITLALRYLINYFTCEIYVVKLSIWCTYFRASAD